MSPSKLADEQLGLIRRTFFAGAVDSDFYQQRDFLLQAIAFPAAHLKERYGVSTPDSLSRAILSTVIETIKAHGAKKRDRFSVYFLHCVQQRMAHHGEEYYNQAKAARRVAESLPELLSKVRIGETERSTDILVALHRTLKSKGGRKKRSPASQLDFTLLGRDSEPVQTACKQRAQPARDSSEKLLKPRDNGSDSRFSSQSRSGTPADS